MLIELIRRISTPESFNRYGNGMVRFLLFSEYISLRDQELSNSLLNFELCFERKKNCVVDALSKPFSIDNNTYIYRLQLHFNWNLQQENLGENKTIKWLFFFFFLKANVHSGRFQPVRYDLFSFLFRKHFLASENERKRTVPYRLKLSGVDIRLYEKQEVISKQRKL